MALHRVTDDFIAHLARPRRRRRPRRDHRVPASSRPRCSTSRPPGCCPTPRWRTPRTSPCWRPATCCSPGCCSTARTSRWRGCSSSWRRARRGGSRARWRWRSGSPRCCRRCCSASTPRRSPSSPPRCSGPSRRPPSASTTCTPPQVSVAEHAALLAERLAALGRPRSPRSTADCAGPLEVVARFLAVLDLFRNAAVELEQPEAFGELTVRWTP